MNAVSSGLALPTIVDILVIGEHLNTDAKCFRVQLRDGVNQVELANRLAVRLVHALSEASRTAFPAWLARYEGGPPHPAAMVEELEAFVMADFRPDKDPELTRLLGAVVEHLWAELAPSLEGTWGTPIYVEHDHFSVIDHGGDGLSLYEPDGPFLRFRLWESKRHTGTGSVTSIFTGAANQLKGSAASYLARMAKPLQLHADERVRVLAGDIVTLWTTQDACSAVGVSVGRSSIDHVPVRPLQGLVAAFGFPQAGRYEGLIVEIPDLSAFGSAVRAAILKGIE